MPEIFRAFGLVFVIFPDDHDPPHVHVFKSGGQCKIMLREIRVCAKPRCTLSTAELRKALELATENRLLLIRQWSEIHD